MRQLRKQANPKNSPSMLKIGNKKAGAIRDNMTLDDAGIDLEKDIVILVGAFRLTVIKRTGLDSAGVRTELDVNCDETVGELKKRICPDQLCGCVLRTHTLGQITTLMMRRPCRRL